MKKPTYNKPKVTAKKIAVRFYNKKRLPDFNGPTYLAVEPEC